MLCKDCKKLIKIANTDETRQGLCSAPTSYFPVDIDEECKFTPKPYTCGDCDRLDNDTACFSCSAEDSAFHNGQLCSGFLDKYEIYVLQALTDWDRRGYNVENKVNDILQQFQKGKEQK